MSARRESSGKKASHRSQRRDLRAMTTPHLSASASLQTESAQGV